MLSLSRVLLASKRRWWLKCSACHRLLPSANFPRTNVPSHTLVCASCKKVCVLCHMRLLPSEFASQDSDTCRGCAAKEAVAQQNVYYRYPVLRYRASPFSVEAMRDELAKEQQQQQQQQGQHDKTRVTQQQQQHDTSAANSLR